MTNTFDSLTASAAEACNDFAGRSVEYRRGDASVVLTAVHTSREYKVADVHGLIELFESEDFLIIANTLILDSVAAIPAIADQIRITTATGVDVYECLKQKGDLPHYGIEAAGTRFRVRTKKVDTEALP